MAHVVYAAPGIRRFHLHERLRRQLLRREHRVSVLCADRVRGTFWREQLDAVHELAPSGRAQGPWDEALARGVAQPGRRQLRGLVAAAIDWLERERPDLMLHHEDRGPVARALQFAARTVAVPVLWTGDGLLPHTMQADERGLDGDSGALRWELPHFAVVEPDPGLLEASLAHALAGATPLGLPRAEVRVPSLARRLADAGRLACAGRFASALHAVHAWRSALAVCADATPPPPSLHLPQPFVALLLQPRHDPRVREHAPDAPGTTELLAAVVAAAGSLAEDAKVVCVAPSAGEAELDRLRREAARHGERVVVVPRGAAAVAAAAAAATVTINHPLGVVALLAGTPLVHLASALYDVRGLTTRCALGELPAALAAARAEPARDLRSRHLTWLLRHGHVWCSATEPSHNGVLGLVQRIERTLANDPQGPLPYRAGPAWPLSSASPARDRTPRV